MEPLAFVAATLFVLGAPALSAVCWLRSQDARADSVELVAVAYGGVAVAALSVWTVVLIFGSSWRTTLLGVVAGAALVAAPALLRAGARSASIAKGADDEPPLTGQHDGRVVPDAVAAEKRRLLGAKAPPRNPHFGTLAVAGLVFALLSYAAFVPYGMERADGIHRMAMTDWYKHIVTATALNAADSFPPPNPFLHVSEPAPYYYGFHLVAASVARFAGAIGDPEAGGDPVFAALLLLTLLTAAATPFVAYTAARSIGGGRGGGLGDTSSVPLFAALGATFLAGFDLIPMAIDALGNVIREWPLAGGFGGLREIVPSTHLDYWIHHNDRQFNAPYLTTVWAPQHMAAVLVALLVIHLVVRRAQVAERSADSRALGHPWLLPGVLLAGLPALSAYVAVGLAAGVGAALVLESLRERCLLWRTRSLGLWLAPGMAAAVMAVPVVMVLAAGPGPGFEVAVSPAGRWVNGAVFSSLFGAHLLTNIADTLAVYVVELGVLGVLAFLEVRRRRAKNRLEPHQRHLWSVVLSILVLVALVRPPLDGPNNLYARPLVLVWFLLAPFAAMRVARISGAVVRAGGVGDGDHAALSRAHRPRYRSDMRWTLAGLSLCALATAYALVGVVLEGTVFWATPPATVDAARWVNVNTPPGAVVAVAPADFESSQLGYWLRRPLALGDERHALLFGADAEHFAQVAAGIERAIAAGDSGTLRAAGAQIALVRRSLSSGAAAGVPGCLEELYENDEWAVLRLLECRP